MKIRKGVITAAARGQRLYPVADTIQKAMLPVIDIDGLHKPVIQIIAEEAYASGIEELCIICAPGDGAKYISAFTSLRDNLLTAYNSVAWAKSQAEAIEHLLNHVQFVEQKEPLGYGHAVYCAKDFINNEPFLLLLGDYLYTSGYQQKRCAAQVIELASLENCSVSAVNPTIEHQITRYGTLTGKQVANTNGVYEVEKIIEKPSLSLAELELLTPGLRVGYYLCFFGMHVFTPAIFDILQKQIEQGNYVLTTALQELAMADKYLALEVKGNRYDLSRKNGLLRAQIALGLTGEAHDEILNTLVEALAEANQSKN
jgi:UTP--glucose-1-phosphate uridylyltransferase